MSICGLVFNRKNSIGIPYNPYNINSNIYRGIFAYFIKEPMDGPRGHYRKLDSNDPGDPGAMNLNVYYPEREKNKKRYKIARGRKFFTFFTYQETRP